MKTLPTGHFLLMRLGDRERLGYAYSNSALIAFGSSDLETATQLFRKAYEHFKKAALPQHCVRTMNNLAQVMLDLGRLRASRRLLLAAARLAGPLEQHRSLALTRILLGEIDSMEHRDDLATKRWKEAAETAKRLNDKILRFKAEFLLFRQAREQENYPVARSLQRRLQRLSNWVPGETYELKAFRQMTVKGGYRLPRTTPHYWSRRSESDT